MTIEQRKEIFAKEVWTISDIIVVFEYDNLSPNGAYSAASAIIREIKRKGFDRLHIVGKIHIQDYFDCYKLPPYRYVENLSYKPLDNKDEKKNCADLKSPVAERSIKPAASPTPLIRSSKLIK